MLHLIVGRIDSGKSEIIYSKTEKLINSGDKDVLFIVPEQYSFETEKSIIARLGTLKADKVEVFSFTFLAKHLLKLFGDANLPEVDDSIRAVIMSLALEQVGDRLEFYSKTRYTQGFISEMMGAFKEMRQWNVSSDDLFSVCGEVDDLILKSKIKDLSLISKAYTAILEQSYFDDETSLDRLHTLISDIDWFNGKTVFIDGFRGFTAQELKIIGDILSKAKDVYVSICADKITGIKDKYSVFAHTRRTARKLLALNDKCSMVPAEITVLDNPCMDKSDEIRHLEGQLYSVVPEQFDKVPENIVMCRCESFSAECDWVASQIKKLISEKNYRCRDIAIIARNAGSYESSIKSSLKKFGVPVFVDKRQPVMTQPLVNFVNSAIRIAWEGFTVESVMRLLKTGLTGISYHNISVLENYVVMWKVNGSRWCDDFKGHPDGLGNEMLERDAELLDNINKTRKSVVVPLLKFRKALADTDGEKAAKAVYDLLVDFNVAHNLRQTAFMLKENGELELALEQNRIWDILIGILNNIAKVLKNTYLNAKRFAELFNTLVSRYTMGALPNGLDEVLIGSADRVQTTSPKVVFAVGMNDGVFPYVNVPKKVLSRNERQSLKNLGVELGGSADEDVMEERFISYKTLCAAGEKLYLSYPVKNIAGEELSASELITQVLKIFPRIKVFDTAIIDKVEYLRSSAASFEILAKGWKNPDSVTETLKQYFLTDSTYKDKLKALKRAADKKVFAIEDKNIARQLFGNEMYMSATRVDTYYKCPFEYFCKYGIQAKVRKSAELDPMQKGTVIHYVLEMIIKTYGSEALCKMSDDAIETIVMSVLKEYFEIKMSPLQEMGERFNYLYLTLGRTVTAVAKRLIREFSVSEFVPVDFELSIDNDSEVKPFLVELSDGGSIKLKGSVDRVDMMTLGEQKFVRVIDYKSGGKNFQLSDVFYGLNMQMLIYLFSIWKNGTGKYENIIPSGVLYMPVKANAVNIDRNASEEELLSNQLIETRMNGLVLDDSRVIIGMDSEKSGLFIPVKYDEKKCVFTGSLIGINEMELLSRKVEDLLRKMGDCLHDGYIPAVPSYSTYYLSAYTDSCKFCDYKSVCGFEANDPRTEIVSISDKECFEKLNEEKDGDTDA